MKEAPQVSFPSTDLEVKIMLPVSFCGSVLNAGARYIWILLSESLSRLQDDKQAAHQGASQNTTAIACPANAGVQCALPDSSFTLVWSVIQFTSQVFPPSSENDCSKWGEFVLVFDQINRTSIDLPLGPDGSVS